MSEFKTKSITTKGMELLSKAISGEQLEFTRIEMGSGVFEGDIGSAEALVEVRQSLPINKITRKGSQVTLSTSLKIEDITTPFEWTEIGVYAKGKGGMEMLYLYGYTQNSSFVSKDSLNEKLINVAVMVSNASNITATIDNSLIYLTAEALENHAKDISAHQDIRDSVDELRGELNSIDISWEGIKDKPTSFTPATHDHQDKLVLEVGKYIDFHEEYSKADWDTRLWTHEGKLLITEQGGKTGGSVLHSGMKIDAHTLNGQTSAELNNTLIENINCKYIQISDKVQRVLEYGPVNVGTGLRDMDTKNIILMPMTRIISKASGYFRVHITIKLRGRIVNSSTSSKSIVLRCRGQVVSKSNLLKSPPNKEDYSFQKSIVDLPQGTILPSVHDEYGTRTLSGMYEFTRDCSPYISVSSGIISFENTQREWTADFPAFQEDVWLMLYPYMLRNSSIEYEEELTLSATVRICYDEV